MNGFGRSQNEFGVHALALILSGGKALMLPVFGNSAKGKRKAGMPAKLSSPSNRKKIQTETADVEHDQIVASTSAVSYSQRLLNLTWLLQPEQLRLRRALQALRNQQEEPSRPVQPEPVQERLLPERFAQGLQLQVQRRPQVHLPAFGNRQTIHQQWKERAMSGSTIS
ncbi:MAG: hypothetical protein ACAH09_12835 [Methylophilaceae bacterium]|nr:hypothetical protein [Methylophilaceae bacterium]